MERCLNNLELIRRLLGQKKIDFNEEMNNSFEQCDVKIMKEQTLRSIMKESDRPGVSDIEEIRRRAFSSIYVASAGQCDDTPFKHTIARATPSIRSGNRSPEKQPTSRKSRRATAGNHTVGDPRGGHGTWNGH